MALVDVADHEGVWVLRIARPPVNAIDLELVRGLEDEVTRAERSGCRGVVITGAPPAFCAGIDVKVVPGYDRDTRREMLRAINRTIARLYALPRPTVAAINGHALGGGLVVALACDIRLAALGDYKLGLTEVTAGIPFPAVPMAVVQATLDPDTARRLCLGGGTFGPTDPPAERFLDACCAPDQLLSAALARAAAAGALTAYAAVKRQLTEAPRRQMEEIVARDVDPMLEAWF